MSIDRAKTLRRNASPAEARMWRLLHHFRTGGYHFRKQVQIGHYYADIACHHAQLVIEVDGDTHGTDAAERYDAARDAYLRSRGYTVLRFTNQDVLHNPDGVFLTVSGVLENRPPKPRLKSATTPSPTLPARGRVPPGGLGTIAPQPRSGTSPLAGEDGRGVRGGHDAAAEATRNRS